MLTFPRLARLVPKGIHLLRPRGFCTVIVAIEVVVCHLQVHQLIQTKSRSLDGPCLESMVLIVSIVIITVIMLFSRQYL